MGSMLVSTATAELLSLALQRDVRQIDAVLNTMQQRGLVSLIPQTGSTPAHYRLHDLTYSYARARFAQHGGDRAPLIEAVQQFVEAHMEDYDVLEFEQHNILGAVQAAQYVDNNSALIDIIRILAVEGEYFAARGHTPTSLQLLKDAIAAAKREKQSELAHYLLSKLGNAYREFYGDLDNAMRAYQEALELAPNETREAILLSVMGTTRFMQGGDDVTTFYERAEEIARTHHDTSALLVALQHRGYYAMKNEDYDSGRMLSDEAARIAEEMNSSQYHFMALMNRGECENLLGNYEQALATHQEAYELARLQNNHVWMAHALRDIGEDFHALGDRVQAQESLTGALKLWWQSEINAQAADLVSYMEEKQYVVPPQTQ
jgi:tetratricopeptide (TPR) repeat protein